MRTDPALEALLVGEQATMVEALRVIDANASGVAFVVDAARHLRGVITDGDIRRAILAGHRLDTPVTRFMTTTPVIAGAGEPPETTLARFTDSIRHLPVVDAERRVVDFASMAHQSHLPVASPSFDGNELHYVAECIATGWISSQGRFVTDFEQRFARFCGTRHAVAVSNGTVALHLALVLAGAGDGDEVIVPTLTFVATANAVRYTGARPVFVDCDPDTWTMDPRAVEAAVTPRTKAIIPVHLYGHPADMDPLSAIASRHGLSVIEDAAQAHGARYRARPVGGLGRIACFSFFANKIVTTGEGGMLTTDDDALADRARLLRDHGMSRSQKYVHDEVGFNYRLTNLQAAVGVAQMERVGEFLERRRRVARWYTDRLRRDTRLTLHAAASWAEPVPWLFTLLLPEGCDREGVIDGLGRHGVDSRPVFHPVHRQPAYRETRCLPVSESIAARGLTLPTAASMPEEQVERVCTALREAL